MTSQIVDVLSQFTVSTVSFLPNLVAAVILLVVGLVVGKIVGRVVKEALEKLKLDYYVSETHKPSVRLGDLFGLVARWWIYLAFISAALSTNVLGIPSLALWVSEISAFIPRIIGAAVILIAGYVLAEYIRGHLVSLKKLYAEVVGKMLFFFVMYVALALALPILGVSAVLVNNILIVIIASVGLAMAIALGLGLKDAVSDVSKRYVKKLRV